MKLCILSAAECQDEDPAPYFRDWDAEMHWIRKATAFQQIRALSQKHFDIFVNLCDGLPEDEEAGVEVVHALERLNLPFTGAASEFYALPRDAMKRAALALRINTPRFFFLRNARDAERAAARLHFPLIVKHPNGHCSIGLSRESRIGHAKELRVQVRRTIAEFGGALVEEFVEGREFTVLVVENADDAGEPFAYRPAEFLFPERESFKHYDLKWVEYNSMRCVPCDDPMLARGLMEVSKRLFVGLNGSGYARCDFRVDARGQAYLLEINPSCGILYPAHELGSADFILTQHPSGHRDFVERIVRAALARHRASQPMFAKSARSRSSVPRATRQRDTRDRYPASDTSLEKTA